MKRSEINAILRDAIDFLQEMHFQLPAFAYWTPEDWKEKGHEFDEIRENMLGWDIMDNGQDPFEKVGLFLFTIRNGSQQNPEKYPKTYAEKVLISREGQVTPIHFHWNKMEDIINRGGGNLMVQVWNAGEDNTLADTPVTVTLDGEKRVVEAGTVLRILPGQSITLPQRQYHSFWGEEGHGSVLIGEVSMVNDDNTDNCFYKEQGRFPTIVEDEAPLYYLCNEYPTAP